ncbi:unnamed protein product [Cylindrotheca closterium]|uniref:Uncharacterized protein n=1 Tax=Cylindrotheca closterium TaxID=2856 RepID=A0AAD2JPL3_9STRA|nr:unnamed protein product [Cylindrotheca closterium]
MPPSIPKPIVIYAINGSQFVFKALAALQSRDVPHYVTFVPLGREAREKVLPGGGFLVPQMKVGDGENPTVVTDSEDILHWIDDNVENAGLYPNEKAKELSERASDHTLAAMVWYYNNVDPTGYSKSIQPSIRNAVMPWFVPSFIGNGIVTMLTRSMNAEKREAIVKAIPDIDVSTLDDEPAMRKRMIAELVYFQQQLETPHQKYLLPDTDRPTAADISVYAQVARLLAGGTNDSEVLPCCPELRDESALQRLWEWYDLMKTECHVEFKGKRAPQSML